MTGSTILPFRIIVRFLTNPTAIAELNTAYGNVAFRRMDELAIEEVLFDQEYAFLAPHLRDRSAPIIVDAGAHIGTFALWVLNQNPKAQITSVEADPETFKILQINQLRGVDAGADWSIRHSAASAADGEELSFDTSGHSMSHRIGTGGGAKVKSISLEGLLKDIVQSGNRVDILKVDIEGAELDFLKNETPLGNVDVLIVELHPKACDTEKVKEILSRNFEKIEDMHDAENNKPLLYCTLNKSVLHGFNSDYKSS